MALPLVSNLKFKPQRRYFSFNRIAKNAKSSLLIAEILIRIEKSLLYENQQLEHVLPQEVLPAPAQHS
jgi:hypothetical protein